MVGPTANAVDPGFKHIEVAVVKLVCEVLKKEDSQNLFFQNSASEQLVGNLNEELETLFLEDFGAHFAGEAPQCCRIPAVRFNVLFEKPLHTFCVLGGASAFEGGTEICGDFARCGSHGLKQNWSSCVPTGKGTSSLVPHAAKKCEGFSP